MITNTIEVPRLQPSQICCDHMAFEQHLLMNMNGAFYPQSLANVSLRTDINRSLLSSDIYPESLCVQRALWRRALGQQRVH